VSTALACGASRPHPGSRPDPGRGRHSCGCDTRPALTSAEAIITRGLRKRAVVVDEACRRRSSARTMAVCGFPHFAIGVLCSTQIRWGDDDQWPPDLPKVMQHIYIWQYFNRHGERRSRLSGRMVQVAVEGRSLKPRCTRGSFSLSSPRLSCNPS